MKTLDLPKMLKRSQKPKVPSPKILESERYGRSMPDINLSQTTRLLIFLLIAGIVFVFSVMIAKFCQTLSEKPSSLGNEVVTKKFRSKHKDPSIVWYAKSSKNHELTSIQCQIDPYQYIACDVFDKTNMPYIADAYLFEGHKVKRLPLKRNSKTIWGILQQESPLYQSIMMNEKYLNLFNFSSTFSRHSDVPMPLFWVSSLKHVTSTRYFINTTAKNSLLSNISPVIFLATDCHTITEKMIYVMKLMQYIKIDSYGMCLHNRDFPPDVERSEYNAHLYDDAMLRFIARYKFIIAIENAVCNDYMTEKLWRSIELGVVPIYYGSPLIRDWLPNNKSAILLEDFPTPELLSQHLQYLLSNDTAYEEYLEHKTMGRIANQNFTNELIIRPYQNKLFQVKHRLECFVCEKLHEMEHAMTNVNMVNMVTKKHYDCIMTPTALTFNFNNNDQFYRVMERTKSKVEKFLQGLSFLNDSSLDANETSQLLRM